MLSITKVFRFETAHAISSYDGPCRNIHGHSYVLHVTVSGIKTNKLQMIMDFKDLKRIVEAAVIKDFDHALILKQNGVNISSTQNSITKIIWVREEPTAEFLITEIAFRIQSVLADSIQLKKLRLYETETCYAEWESE